MVLTQFRKLSALAGDARLVRRQFLCRSGRFLARPDQPRLLHGKSAQTSGRCGRLVWEKSMSNLDIGPALKAMGFTDAGD